MRYFGFVLSAVFLIGPQAQAAIILPQASLESDVSVGGTDSNDIPFGSSSDTTSPGVNSVTGSGSDVSGSASVTSSYTPFPSLLSSTTAAASLTAGCQAEQCNSSSSATAILNYDITIYGPSSSTLIPVIMMATGSAYESLYNYNTYPYATFASIYVSPVDGSLGTDDYVAYSPGVDGQNGYLNIDTNLDVAANSLVYVQLRANAGAVALSGDTSSSAQAYIDPYFTIAPGFADASQYQILVSPGVGNSPITSVPELSTWAMVILGLGGLGLASRRRMPPRGGVTSWAAYGNGSHIDIIGL